MSGPADNERHLAISGVRSYIDKAIPGDLLIPGSPEAYLIVEPGRGTVSIHVAGTGPIPDVRRYVHLEADSILWREAPWLRLSVRLTEHFDDLYALLCLVLDGVQIRRHSFLTAVEDALRAYRDLLSQRASLSDQQQVGLFGELSVMDALLDGVEPHLLTAAWVGHEPEEHDFSLEAIDLEVKTTSTERRAHWISSDSQLLSKAGKRLYLVSVMLTKAGAGPGRTLPQLADHVVRRLGEFGPRASRHMNDRGLHSRDDDLYPTRWALRDLPVTFEIDDQFPAVTPPRLKSAVPNAGLIHSITYLLDLHSYPTSQPPAVLRHFTGTQGGTIRA